MAGDVQPNGINPTARHEFSFFESIVSHSQPNDRFSAVLAADVATGFIYIFGGSGANSTLFNDVVCLVHEFFFFCLSFVSNDISGGLME